MAVYILVYKVYAQIEIQSSEEVCNEFERKFSALKCLNCMHGHGRSLRSNWEALLDNEDFWVVAGEPGPLPTAVVLHIIIIINLKYGEILFGMPYLRPCVTYMYQVCTAYRWSCDCLLQN